MTATAVDGPLVVLTAHPLQRIGAYALACLAAEHGTVAGPDPSLLDDAALAAAVEAMTADAVRAALGRDTKAELGFFLKSSLSLFPNSPMFHPSNAKRSAAELGERVRSWRTPPGADRQLATDAPCVLCSRPAVGFYGKMDIPLAESDVYRNTTPRGHEGAALCWPCLCCFYAVPYGSRLTGGPCLAVHSWDEAFLARAVAAQVVETRRVVEVGSGGQTTLPAREVLALRRLRHYEQRLTAGVELLVYSNNNRGPTLEVYALDQPLAEWLRGTLNRPALRRGFGALLRAHRTVKDPGHVGLARNAFRSPQRIPGACASFMYRVLLAPSGRSGSEAEAHAGLAVLCFDFADKVMAMDKSDLDELRATGRRIAALLQRDRSDGQLKTFYSRFRRPADLRGWLQRQALDWVIYGGPAQGDGSGSTGPLLTTRGFGLLFDPDYDNQAWFHRQLLLVAVFEELAVRGWRPEKTDDTTEDLPEIHDDDTRFVDGNDDGEDVR